MKAEIDITEADPFAQTTSGFYKHNGDIYFRQPDGSTWFLEGAIALINTTPQALPREKESTPAPAPAPAPAPSAGIDGEQLIRLMKLAAHVQSPQEVKDL